MPFFKPNYDKLWFQVEKFTREGLPKSANDVVDKIFEAARRDRLADQYIKALIYRLNFLQELEETPFKRIHELLTAELKVSVFPVTPIVHSMMAEQYWSYYQQNRYRFLNRTPLETIADDVETWDLKTLAERVIKHYQASLEQAEVLQGVPVEKFDALIVRGNVDRVVRPTLYDFLAHRAVRFFMDSEAGLTQPADSFTLNNMDYFKPAREFAALEIVSPDPLAFHYHAMKGIQELIRFHLNDDKPDALLDADLMRLRFLFDNAAVSNQNLLYENRLVELRDQWGGMPLCAGVYYELAKLYKQLGDEYKPAPAGMAPGGEDVSKWMKKKALETCRMAQEKFPGSMGAHNCRALETELIHPYISLTLERVVSPNRDFVALAQYRNLSELYLRVVKTDEREKELQKSSYAEAMLDYYIHRDPVRQWRTTLPQDGDLQNHGTEIAVEGLTEGEYVLLASESPEFNRNRKQTAFAFFSVSHISWIHAQSAGEGLTFYVADRETGLPLSGVKLQTWIQQYDNTQRRYVKVKHTLYSGDDKGLITVIPRGVDNRYFFLEFIDGEKRLFVEDGLSYYDYYTGEKRSNRTWFFTDRAIYRPGQTVFFKGLILDLDSENAEKTKIIPGCSVTVVLNDGNGQKVSELNLRSNKFGTFSGSFQLPLGRMTGRWTITDGHGSVGFSVEEYKRPKFEVVFPAATESYKLDDMVTMKGKAAAFAGYNISGAQVRYRVTRNVYYPYRLFSYWWDPRPLGPAVEIVVGTLKTADNGEFEITFRAIPDLTIPTSSEPAFSFVIHADVTDVNGETRSGDKTISIGYKALLATLNIPEMLSREGGDPEFKITTSTLDGAFIPAVGAVEIYRLDPPGRVLRGKYWSEPDQQVLSREEYIRRFPNDSLGGEESPLNWKKLECVLTQGFDTAKETGLKIAGLTEWPSGKYRVELNTKDRYGSPVKNMNFFTLYSQKEGPLPYKMLGWFTPLTYSAEPGETATALIGSAADNVSGFYEVQFRNRIIEKQFFTLNNEQKLIRVPIREEHRGNVGIHVVFVKHNRRFEYRHNIDVPWSNKNLDVSFESFRGKLYPGQKEEWRIRIRDKQGKGFVSAAEMAAVLYDASLDAFVTHGWAFSPFSSYSLWERWLNNSYFGTVSTTVMGPPLNTPGVVSPVYDYFNWFGFYLHSYSRMRMMTGAIPPPSPAAESSADMAMPAPKMAAPGGKRNGDDEKKESVAMGAGVKNSDVDASKPPQLGDPGKFSGSSQVKTRANFQETAFFQPHLVSDENGVVTISFSIPEALTRWKMMGLAHTQDLKYGFVSNQLVTQKDLMVEPNAPRFFREGDAIELTAKIANLSGKALQGTAKLQLIDAATFEPVDVLFGNTQPEFPFTVEKDRSIPVRWKITVPETVDTVIYRIIAQAGQFSDGEEKPAPVLKNRMLVTESLPLPVRPGETKSFTLDKLVRISSPTLRHHLLTLEFTANPVWYAIQALPYLMEFPYECMEQLFSRFYANSIAAHIALSDPGIRRVFEIWQNTPGSGSLLSNLEKNPELKSVLLEETPWVMDARNESERKKRVAMLFDINRMAMERDVVLAKLKEGQAPSGAWPWFKGMPESRFITQHILCGFARLRHLNVFDPMGQSETETMIRQALVYLDEEMTKEYRWLMKNVKNPDDQHIGYVDIHYLHTRSYYREISINGGAEAEKAFSYYKKQAQKYWVNFHGYMQGMIALALNRYADEKTAQAIVKSLREHSLSSEEMGVYWKQERGYYWYRAPIETQALLIEVFDEVAKDSRMVDEMRLWLLKQKQAQDWGTTKATAEACYALLLRGSAWLGKTESPEISLGRDLPIKVMAGKNDITSAEAGSGYFKTAWRGGEIKSDMGYVTVRNPNAAPAWGGLYWQYFENLDKITPAETPLKLEKKLYVERMGDRGPVLKELTSEQLNVGDRVKVRIVLRADRDMEYVHMKDLRASGFEPEDVLSTYSWRDGIGYYQSTRDTATHFFFAWLPKGSYVFEYNLRVTHAGDFSNGIASIQCMYAPEFTAHSDGVRVKTSNAPGL